MSERVDAHRRGCCESDLREAKTPRGSKHSACFGWFIVDAGSAPGWNKAWRAGLDSCWRNFI